MAEITPEHNPTSDVVEGNENSGVLGSSIARKEILSITFLDSLDEMPDNAWDVSADKNKKVMAWTISGDGGYDLYIGGEGGIAANEDSSWLFASYTNVEKISINGNLHTENATNMCAMFLECRNLKALDIANFDTSNVTDMSYMFQYCSNLTSLNISKFDTSNVTEATNMFLGCDSLKLKESDVSNFSPELVEIMGITW